jgi:hypothetical protein
LQNNAISDEGIKNLSGFTYLESLNLSGTKVSNRSLDEIGRWKSLKKLFLYNTGISEESLADLKKSNPSIEVYNTAFNLSDTLYNARLTLPQCKIDSTFFSSHARVEVKLSRGNVKYYYTLDGSDPTPEATLYQEPFHVDKTGYVKLMSTMKGWEDSPIATYPLLKVGKKPQLARLDTKPDAKRKAKLDSTLLDGKWGSMDRHDGEYVGFMGESMQMSFQFETPQDLSQVTLSYLDDEKNGVMPPLYLEVWGGASKATLKKLAVVKAEMPGDKEMTAKKLLIGKFDNQPITYIKLIAKNRGELPNDHPLKKTSKSWLFVDEVSLE